MQQEAVAMRNSAVSLAGSRHTGPQTESAVSQTMHSHAERLNCITGAARLTSASHMPKWHCTTHTGW
jgi:hypothetical protein